MTLKYKYRNTRRATREAKAHQMLAALLTHRHIQKEAVAVITRDRRQSSSSEITQQLKSLMAQWAVCFDSEWVEHCTARFLYIAAFAWKLIRLQCLSQEQLRAKVDIIYLLIYWF